MLPELRASINTQNNGLEFIGSYLTIVPSAYARHLSVIQGICQ